MLFHLHCQSGMGRWRAYTNGQCRVRTIWKIVKKCQPRVILGVRELFRSHGHCGANARKNKVSYVEPVFRLLFGSFQENSSDGQLFYRKTIDTHKRCWMVLDWVMKKFTLAKTIVFYSTKSMKHLIHALYAMSQGCNVPGLILREIIKLKGINNIE